MCQAASFPRPLRRRHRAATQDFYRQFYQVELSEAELYTLLANAPEKR